MFFTLHFKEEKMLILYVMFAAN